MPQGDVAQAWLGFDEGRRKSLLSKMTPEQKANLRRSLEASGHGTKKMGGAGGSWEPAPTYGGEIAAAGERVVSGLGGGIKNLLTPHDTAGATRAEEVKMGPIGRFIYNMPADIEEGLMNAEGQREAAQRQGEGRAGQALAYSENLPFVGGMVRKAEEAGPGYAKFSPETFGAVTEGVTYAALPQAIEKAAPLVKKVIPKLPAPRVIKDLVKSTKAANVKGAAEYAEDQAAHIEASKQVEEHNRAEIAKHTQAVNDAARENRKAHMKHLAGKAEAEGANATAKAIPEARATLEADIKAKSDLLDVKTEAARHNALAEGNKKYSTVNESLNHIPANDEAIGAANQEAFSSIQGTHVKPPILQSIAARLEEGGLSYEDLQGYYSELGKELSKGTLPGDVYHAYDTMHEAIGEDMQRIADAKGMGAQLTAAREFWRRMKQTFGKSSDAAGDRAAKFVGDEAPGTVEEQQRQYRQRLLGSFDPTIPGLADQVAKARADLKSLPKEGAASAEVPQYPEAIEVKPPNIKKGPAPPAPFKEAKIGATEVENTKAEKLQGTADWIRRRGAWVATWPVFRVLLDAMRGNGFPIGEAALESGATLVATYALAAFLENPKVVEFLSKATVRDVEAIPPDLRGDFPGIVKAAQAKGIKVSPAIVAIYSAKGPAPRNASDEHAGTYSKF